VTNVVDQIILKMKAILEFNLPEDNKEFLLASKAQNWWSVCWEMDQWLRAQYKHMPDEEYSEGRYKAFVESREKLFELMRENGVSLDDVE